MIDDRLTVSVEKLATYFPWYCVKVVVHGQVVRTRYRFGQERADRTADRLFKKYNRRMSA